MMIRCVDAILLAVATLAQGCVRVSCGDRSDPEPQQAPMLPEHAYEMDDGDFAVVVHVDDAEPWPPLPGTLELELEVIGLEPGARAVLTVLPPSSPSLDMTAPGPPPTTILLDDATWRLGGVELPEPSVWLVPIAIRQGWRDDSITLVIEVAEAVRRESSVSLRGIKSVSSTHSHAVARSRRL